MVILPERNSKLIYVNSANLSLCPAEVMRAVEFYRREFEENPTDGLSRVWGRLWEVQGRLSEFLGTSSHNLFLRPNVTEVLNTFIMGTKLPPSSEIVVGEFEYGAIVNICRLKAEREGLRWRILQLPATPAAFKGLDRKRLAEGIVSQLGSDTRMLLLSHVVGGTGLVLPIEEVSAVTRARGITLVVDGAYAPGAIPVDFKELARVDFYGCSLYKWLMGPKGTAFGWVSDAVKERLLPQSAGWTTFDSHGPFAAFGQGDAFQSAFLMSGCRDFAPFLALNETIAMWERLGKQVVRERLDQLGRFLTSEISRKLGWRKLEAADPSLQSPIHVFRLPDRLQSAGERLKGRLLDEYKIQAHTVPLRESWYLSFSPHVYNSEAELERMAEVLCRL